MRPRKSTYTLTYAEKHRLAKNMLKVEANLQKQVKVIKIKKATTSTSKIGTGMGARNVRKVFTGAEP